MDLLILLGIAALGASLALWPVLAGHAAARPRAAAAPALDDAALDREVARYREALRAGTVCGRCRFANPPDGQYCADCGARLPGA